MFEPIFTHAGVSSYLGDNREVLRSLPAQSVNCCVTSPPYFGLRNYQHERQLGLEATPDEYVAAMVDVFREVRRVLRDDATLWLNLGDSYASSGVSGLQSATANLSRHGAIGHNPKMVEQVFGRAPTPPGLKPKNLIGIPWKVAFALQSDGWILRQDIVWAKPNPMPESVTDRCTKSHEYIFMLSKSSRYFYDAQAIAEPLADSTKTRVEGGNAPRFGGSKYGDDENEEHRTKSGNSYRPQLDRALELAKEHGLTQEHLDAIRAVGLCDAGKAQVTQTGFGKNTPRVIALAEEAKTALNGYYREFLLGTTRNKRSVWTVATQPCAEAHFATFPPKLIEPCILAGCPADGVVLDPFFGSGTTGMVARALGRKCIGIDLNPDYIEIQKRRLNVAQGVLFDA